MVSSFLGKIPNCLILLRRPRAVTLGASVAHDTSTTTVGGVSSASLPRWLGVDRNGVLSLTHFPLGR